MRRLSVLGLAIAAIIGAVIAVSFPLRAQAPVVNPSPVLIVSGQSIAGVALGRSVQSVIARIGPPSEVRMVRNGMLYVFTRFGLTVYTDGDVVRAVSATNSLFKTPEGVALGSSEEDVRRIYGVQLTEAVVEGMGGFAYDHLGLAFAFDSDRRSVATIMVYSPHEDAEASAFVALPQIGNLRPYSGETRYMSMTGYLRRLVFEQSGIWISYRDAGRLMRAHATVRG